MPTVNIFYRASAVITIAPQNIASSATFVAGVSSSVYDNTVNKDVDVLIAGVWRSGTTPTANTQVVAYIAAVRDDTPTYPDVFDGTSSAKTLTSVGVGQGFLRIGGTANVDSATTGRDYSIGPFSVASLFGGALPLKFILFITHNTGVNSDATAGNHVWKATGVNYTVN